MLPFEEILEIGDMYWEPLVSVLSNWTPSQDTNSLFYREFDKSNPCKFENFRVWT
jgi:homospermidine synthase